MCIGFSPLFPASLDMHMPRTYVAIISVLILLTAFLLFRSPLEPAYSLKKMADLLQAFQKLNQSCFILGASGQSGKALLSELLRTKPFSRIVLIGRRKLEFPDDAERAKLEQRLIDFDKLEQHKDAFLGFDVGYSCLGTSQAISGDDGFVKLEFDYVVGAAKLAREGGCKHYQLVSAMHANENSSFLYTKTKGRADRVISEMGFERASIYRPAFLLGERDGRGVMGSLVQLMWKPVACIAPTAMTVPIELLAKAMVMNTITSSSQGAEIIDNKKIHALGKSLPV